jgi:hypothetical protein
MSSCIENVLTNKRYFSTLETIKMLIGNVDHSKGNGVNSAKMRGELLNDIRDIIDQCLKNSDDIEECTCGNTKMGFNCACQWMKNNPGNKMYTCIYCGIYQANKPMCSICEEENDG